MRCRASAAARSGAMPRSMHIPAACRLSAGLSAAVVLALLSVCLLYPATSLSTLNLRPVKMRWGLQHSSTGGHSRQDQPRSLLSLKLRGAGAGELFDDLMQPGDRVGFLANAYQQGDAAVREQAVGYTTLLMSEEGFLENMTPLQLLRLCIEAPDLVRECACSLPESITGDDAAGPLQMMLAGLPEAIDVLSLRALLKHSNSSISRDIAGLPAGGSVQDAVRVLLECPGFCRRIAASDTWSQVSTEHTLLGALLRRSPMEDLSHWEDVGEQIKLGDSLEGAIARSTSEMKALQEAWEENQAASARLVGALFESPHFNQSLLVTWFEMALHSGRERTTEAARMLLLGTAVMPDGVALNLLDMCLRVYEPHLLVTSRVKISMKKIRQWLLTFRQLPCSGACERAAKTRSTGPTPTASGLGSPSTATHS